MRWTSIFDSCGTEAIVLGHDDAICGRAWAAAWHRQGRARGSSWSGGVPQGVASLGLGRRRDRFGLPESKQDAAESTSPSNRHPRSEERIFFVSVWATATEYRTTCFIQIQNDFKKVPLPSRSTANHYNGNKWDDFRCKISLIPFPSSSVNLVTSSDLTN